jgi:gliding motility-associated-like protein
MINRVHSILVVFFLIFQAKAQLITAPGAPPAGLVQNILLGPGVTVSNIQYNGASTAISSFTASNSNLGITSGIVITTGTVFNNGAGPQGPNNQSNAGVDNQFGGSPLLNGLSGGTTYNAATLEFDFIPYADTVRFRYVFGSEEYPEYAPPNNTSYNDVFGFYISGPGFPTPQNIAQLPNGSIVSINNVNPITNSQFYNANGDGSSAPQNGSNFYIQYDGFTDVLEAVAKVQCGQTYHLVLAIADVEDPIFDSGIFLEANSLSSNVPVEVTYTLSEQAFSDPDVLAEGCVSATITLERGANGAANPLTIPVNVSGTATEGVDYTNLPNSITFPAGQTMVQFSLDAFADGITEGLETLLIEFPITDPCGNITPLLVELAIDDIDPVTVTVESGDVLCPGDNLELIAIASGGVGPYTYSWNTGESTSSIFVSPTSTQTFTVSVTDACLNQTATGSGTVNVPVYPPITIQETADITEICPYLPMQLEAIVNGGAGNYTYQWYIENGEELGNQQTQIVTPPATTTYWIVVTDQCGLSDSVNVLYTITSPPLVLSISPPIAKCPEDTVTLTVTATGGYGQYFYYWPDTQSTGPSITVAPTQTELYTVIVSDECQTFTVTDSVLVTVQQPTASFWASSETLFDDLPITFQNWSINAETYSWDFGDGQTSNVVHPNNTYAEPGTYLITLIAVDDLGCVDTVAYPITIEEAWYVYVPNTFTPDGLRLNSLFSVSTIGIEKLSIRVFNRWGEEVYQSEDQYFEWDGSYQNVPVQDGTYTWKIDFLTRSGKERTITGHVNVIR